MENRIAPVAGKSMVDVKNAHGGNAGASIVERIQDELDLAYEIWGAACADPIADSLEQATLEGRTQGFSESLAILRSTTPEEEWKLAEERYSKGE